MTSRLYIRIDPTNSGDIIYLYKIADHFNDQWKVLIHRPGIRTHKTVLSKKWVQEWYKTHNDPIMENTLRLLLL